MEAGMQVDADPNDVTTQLVSTDWDIQKRGDYVQEHGHQPVYSSRKTCRTVDEVSENHHAIDQTNQ